MAESVAKLILEADTKGLKKGITDLNKLKKAANDAEKATNKGGKSQKSFGQILANNKGKIAAVTAGLAAMAFAINRGLKAVEQAGAEFSILNARLVTATGSTIEAAKAFKELNAFALETPFTLQESVNGFALLKNLGLEPTRESMVSFANTSAAMGKSLEQMIEAVADATTFEFERLKEFGIKTKQEGDTVKFTFRGVTTEVGKNADEVKRFLENIGNTAFAGAAIEQTKTLAGSVSNLNQAFDNLKIGIGEVSGANAIFAETNNTVAAAITDPEFVEGLANLTTTFAKLKQAVTGVFTDAVVGAVDIMTTTAQERIDGLENRIDRFRFQEEYQAKRIATIEKNLQKDISDNYRERLNEKLEQAKQYQKHYTDLIARTVAEQNVIAANAGMDTGTLMSPAEGTDIFTGESTNPLMSPAITQPDSFQSMLDNASTEGSSPEIDKITQEQERKKELQAEFDEWKLGQEETELDRMKEKFLREQELVEENEKVKEDLTKAGTLAILAGKQNGNKVMDKLLKGELKQEEITSNMKKKLAFSTAGQLFNLMSTNSKKMFKLQKAAGIANAVVSIARGMAKAKELGWPLGLIAAAKVAISGASDIRKIKSQQFSGGGTAPVAEEKASLSMGGATSGVETAASTVSADESAITSQPNVINLSDNRPDQVVNISVDGSIDPEGARKIIEAINEATDDGLQINAMVGT